jgi:hypothetical protein
MAVLSVAQTAVRLGVSVPRIHQRIADGSLRAQRIGSQWVVDERSLFEVGERKAPGRPLSSRSAWALIALSVGDEEAVARLAPNERARASARLAELFALVAKGARSEEGVRRNAAALRSTFRNRADRVLLKAADADLPALRADARWQSNVSSALSGIASLDVEGYVAEDLLEPLSKDFLLVAVDGDANVIAHVVPSWQKAYPESLLRLAADLADHRAPREDSRAVELLRQVAVDASESVR